MGWGTPNKTQKCAKWGKTPSKATPSSWHKKKITPKVSTVIVREKEAALEFQVNIFSF